MAKKESKKKTPAGTKVTKEFEFKLTREEVAQMGENAANLAGEIDDLETQFEEVKNNWKAKITTRAAKRDETLAIIRAKKEKRTVEAVLVKDFDAKEIQYWVGGEIMEKRTMTEAECQMELDPKPRKRGKEQKLTNYDPAEKTMKAAEQEQREEIANVVKMETNKRSKSSAVDGPTAG